ncbi:hypothetical protein Syun_031511 [Stephania yunnanensis]|uniref:Uncharacterized protein n=1 Tax=Stephania yunnanensis TaxID=152371 RepID=A0AAP0E568_9MAGN
MWRLRDPEAHLISMKELMDQPQDGEHEYVRPLKFSVKGYAHKTSKSNKEHGKKSSSKKYGKKKAYRGSYNEKAKEMIVCGHMGMKHMILPFLVVHKRDVLLIKRE